MKKKLYIQPSIEVVHIDTVPMLAGSLGTNDTPTFSFREAATDNSDEGYDAD